MFGRSQDPLKAFADSVGREFQSQQKRIGALEQHVSALTRAFGSSRKQEDSARMAGLRDQEQHYVQLVVVVGYAGVFTLWVQTRPDMSAWMFASTGALITISILFFVGFELFKALLVGNALSKLKDGDDYVAEHNKAVEKVNRHWLVPFVVSVVSGVTAGLSLLFWFTYRAVAAALGWL